MNFKFKYLLISEHAIVHDMNTIEKAHKIVLQRLYCTPSLFRSAVPSWCQFDGKLNVHILVDWIIKIINQRVGCNSL